MTHRVGQLFVAAAVVLLCPRAGAQTEPPPAEEASAAALPAPDPELDRARELYKRGIEHVKRTEWSEALSAFESSAKLRPHATTTFNIGACERALGNYTRARGIFEEALAQGARQPETLAPSLRTEAEALVREIDKFLVRVSVTLDPPNAAIAVDGRPLESAKSGGGPPVLIAGAAPPGPGRPPMVQSFVLVLNPGNHVITLRRAGHADAVVRKSYTAGARQRLDLRLERLPATLAVSANIDGALVRVSDVDVGPVPVEVLRPAGNYQVRVAKEGFEPYETSVTVRAGEQSALSAKLVPESQALTSKWWFWAGAAAVVATGVIVTYALTRPEPEPPPYDGGSTGWVVQPSGVRF
jgi:hypothetical protein